MRGDHFHPQRGFVDFYAADAVDQSDRFNGPASFHLVKQKVELMLGHPLKRFVFDGQDGPAFLLPAHHAQKMNHGAHAVGHFALRQQRGFLNRPGGDQQLAFHSNVTRGAPYLFSKRAAGILPA